MEIKPIGYIKNGFCEKFGIPRQSGISSALSQIIIEKEFSDINAFRGIEEFSHLWLIWEFKRMSEGFSPTVRPPRLGGNKRMGVFATRSPNRPNSLGLSLVKLRSVAQTADGIVLEVTGADILSGTPIYDIKPYLPSFEAVLESVGGFSDENLSHRLSVVYDEGIFVKTTPEIKDEIIEILSSDPRPSYQEDKLRIYGIKYYDLEVKFRVEGEKLYIISIE